MTGNKGLLTDVSSDPNIISFFESPASYKDKVVSVRHIETHISHIFLTGEFAYKIKKPVKLPFLDFSSLEARLYYLSRELELNRRFAPEIYREIIPIYKSGATYSFLPIGPITEYALKMVQFDDQQLFGPLCRRNAITPELLDALVDQIVTLHKTAVQRQDMWGEEKFRTLLCDNLYLLATKACEFAFEGDLDSLRVLIAQEVAANKSLIDKRRLTHVKQTHGDLHLGNICVHKGHPIMFDGLEFSDEYSCTDVWADFAFLFMDLVVHNKCDLAFSALNRYLEGTDDFEGLKLLRIYSAYRALVRSKVNLLRVLQGNESAITDVTMYLRLAKKFLLEKRNSIIAIGGLSGSGKSTVSRALSRKIGAIHIRSDVVRKNSLNLPLLERAPKSAYSRENTQRVYDALLARADICIQQGFSVILDAVYQGEAARSAVKQFAQKIGLELFGFWCEVIPEVARERISTRKDDPSDADLTIYETQLSNQRKVSDWISIDTNGSISDIIAKITHHLPATKYLPFCQRDAIS